MTQAVEKQAIILGGGLFGRLMAVSLARRGLEVTVYEASPSERIDAAAHVAAAMLAPLAESAVTESSVVAMGVYSIPRWRELISSLKSKVFFQELGTLILWHRQDIHEANRFKKLLEKTSLEIPGFEPLRTIDQVGIHSLEPSLGSQFHQAYYLPQEGQLDNRQLLESLLQEMKTLGVVMHWNAPKELSEFESNKEWVIDCRGLGAKKSLTTLRGIRGEVVRLYAPEVKLQRPVRLMHPKYPIYIAPKENDIYVIGATEIETDDRSEISLRSLLELLSAAYTVHSGFAEARVLEVLANCRPTMPDNLPVIKVIKKNMLAINGLYRHGFMISPAILDATLEYMFEKTTHLIEKLNIHLENSNTCA